jgi:hypothetical protein
VHRQGRQTTGAASAHLSGGRPCAAHQQEKHDEIDHDEDDIPADADFQIAAGEAEIDDLEKQAHHGGNAQPEDPGHHIGQRNDGVGQRAGQVSQGKNFQHEALNSCSAAKFAF